MTAVVTSPVTVFDPAGSGYHTFRIPAVVRTADGAVLAFAEGRRHSAADTGEIDLVLRRSEDGGDTWDPITTVCSVPRHTCGNPAPVLDPASGEVVLLSTRNPSDQGEASLSLQPDGRRVWLQRSSDGGRSWTEPVDLTDTVKRPDWGWYATGPGHGIALRQPPHAGRLVIPANHSLLPHPDVPAGALAGPPARSADDLAHLSGAHALLSDDGGRHWRLGYVDDRPDPGINPNESTVAELPDGSCLFGARNHRGTVPRLSARSRDGGATLDAPFAADPDLVVPAAGVQGSLLALTDGRLLLSTPAHPDRRRRMTVYVSDDGGRSWRVGLRLGEGFAGYSDLVALPDGSVGLCHEAGEQRSNERIRWLRFEPDEL